MSFRVFVTSQPMLQTIDACQERFAAEKLEIVAPQITRLYTEAELCARIAEFDGVIAGDDPFTANVLETGRRGRLRALVRLGVGIDAVDVGAAKRLGIAFSNTPGVFSDEVADLAVGYLLLLSRGLHAIDAAARGGAWLKYQGTSLRGKTVGIIGVGNIGKEIARRLRGFGVQILAHHRHPLDEAFCRETGARQVEFDDLLRHADCIILSCSANPENYHLLNEAAFAVTKAGAWLINVARGSLIAEDALIAALEQGKVGKAALDVFEFEPLARAHPLRAYEQVVLGAHNGSNTKEAFLRANQVSIDILVRFLRR